MNRDNLYSLLLDAMEEYGADDIVGVLNNVLEDIEVKKAKEEQRTAQKNKDAVDLYKQILLFCNTYYPEVITDEEADKLARVAEENPEVIINSMDYYVSLLNEEETSVAPAKEEATPTPTPESTIKVKTIIDGKENNFEINPDQWLDTLADFFDKYNI